MYQSLVTHEFKKVNEVYSRDDGKYIIRPVDIGGRKMFRVFDVDKGFYVGYFGRLKDAKITFGVERKGGESN